MLPDRQQEALDYIKKTLAERGQAPSVREIALALQLSSPSNAQRLVDALRAKGHLVKPKTPARSIKLTEKANDHD